MLRTAARQSLRALLTSTSVCALLLMTSSVAGASVSWVRETAPLTRLGELTAVSCASSTRCVAVGESRSRGGRVVPLAERWNGRRWSISGTARLRHVAASRLVDVSCAHTTCLAVGGVTKASGEQRPLVEQWNGRGWSIGQAPRLLGALTGVSCAGRNPTCTAVGSGGAGWWRRGRWHRLEKSTRLSFVDVSCWSGRRCAALAETCCGSGWRLQQWNRGRSSGRRLPAGLAADSELEALACVSAVVCTVVGNQDEGSDFYGTIALRWNGLRWSEPPAPDIQSAEGSLAAVACTSAVACVAVGSLDDGRTLRERWDGRRWRLDPSKSRMLGSFEGVSCASATACIAVGSDASPLAAVRTASGWSRQSTPTPLGVDDGGVDAISCASSISCMAVGETLATWNGLSWATTSTAHLPAELGSRLLGVSCKRPRRCTAVGWAGYGDGYSVPLVERWDGRDWAVETTPDRVDGNVRHGTMQLHAVSCVTATSCVAVGSSNGAPLAERSSGDRWSKQAPPTPDGASGGELDAVSCVSPQQCTAVGWSSSPDGKRQTLAEAWDGRRWSLERQPSPGQPGELRGVSCATAHACLAVGAACADDACAHRTLAEIWDGASWTISRTPDRGDAMLNGVSCVLPTTCVVVGTAVSNLGGERAFSRAIAESWDGTGWSIEHVPVGGPFAPTGDPVGPGLNAISCTSATRCRAAGSVQYGDFAVPLFDQR